MRAAIEFRDVTLVRRTQEELHYDLKRTLLNIARGRRPQVRRHTVIDRVELRIEHGEKVGIIGPNGSGKSTALKLMAGVLRPTRGTVTTEGTLSALIEIGVGFDPDLTLVDNILFYGVLLGFEETLIRAHVDAILDFAELSEIRDQPTKTLSSGMGARLGFAIATEFRPDVLLLDEVFAVGDERFRRKCGARLDRFWDAHSTIVIVSHDLSHLARMCDRIVWLENGRIRYDGPAAQAVSRYLETVPTANAFRSGEELIALAAGRESGEILIRTNASADSAEMFLVRAGQRHRIASDEWYVRTGVSTAEAIQVDSAIVTEIPEGDPVR
ncbi:MAG: ABC transporter ATP-binding protein [Candidatus Elarobacter sp.]